MTSRRKLTASFFSAVVVVVSLICLTSGLARAGGYYEYYSYPPDSVDYYTYDSGSGWSTSECATGYGDENSTYAYASVSVYASTSSGGPLWQDASASSGACIVTSLGYEWHPDPGDPNEVPPGGTLSYSASGSGGAGASGGSYRYGSEGQFNGACATGASSGGGGSAPGGGAWGASSCSGAVGNNDDGAVSYGFFPEGYGIGSTGPGYFEVSCDWSASDGDSGVPIEPGTTSVGGYAESVAGCSGDASANWNSQGSGSAGGSGDCAAGAGASISISF